MAIDILQIANLRNITTLSLTCSPEINVLYGANGSGKTSILEAVHLLSTGKSFRSHIKSRLIQYDQPALTLFSQIKLPNQQLALGIEKSQDDETKLRFQGMDIQNISEFARVLPVQLLHPHSYELLEGGSKPRRQFIDWGVFHVEQQFYSLWNNAQRILKQRNAALRAQAPQAEIHVWDPELVALAEEIDRLRGHYIEQLIPRFYEILAQITDLPEIGLKYYPGWNRETGLLEQLQQRLPGDLQMGYTHAGPQRADLKMAINGTPIQEFLSRGQQKLVVFALRFAQASLLVDCSDKRVVFLIDDLPSELDAQHQAKLFALIEKYRQDMQFFLTGVHADSFSCLKDSRTFHVKHGAVTEEKHLAENMVKN